jgi:hypothetical protein
MVANEADAIEPYVMRVSVSLTAEERELLLELGRRLQASRGVLVTWSAVVRAAIRAAATGEELS